MITVQNLTKRYGDFTAVNDATFEVYPGRITGFLGPNGAGKSTVMRMICGLTPPTSGTTSVLGVPFASLPNPGRQVGVLLDASAQHPGRTGRETLLLSADMMGLRRCRIDEVLEQVGLTPREATRRVRHYSLGMRQRLGIANALLGDPQVLILDEPVNGLDPEGIRGMRDLLRTLSSDGATVLLSSHLLAEMDQVCDDLIVISHGEIIACGPKDTLASQPGTLVTSVDDDALAAALSRAGWLVSAHGDGGLLTDASLEVVGKAALSDEIVLLGLGTVHHRGLEELYFEVTASTSRKQVTL